MNQETMQKIINITYIVDASGSMSVMKSEVESGINNSLQEYLKDTSGINTKISIVSFNNESKLIINNEPLTDKTKFTNYVPDGITALYDTCSPILKEKISDLTKNSQTSMQIIIIITDGEDNASVNCTSKQIKELIEYFKSLGGIIIFTAANIDVSANSNQLSIDRSKSFNQQITGDFTIMMRSVSSDIASIARESTLGICNNTQPELTTIGV
jgi:Mg-chelatase subunit ChlD